MDVLVPAKDYYPKLLPMLHKMHSESGLRLPAVDDAKVLKSLENCDRVFVVEEEGAPIGVLALSIGEHWFSSERFIGDLVFYVDSAWRATMTAVKLLQHAKMYAIMEKLPLMVAVVDGKDIERKDAFYLRQGFQKAGGVYAFGLNKGLI